MRPRLRHLIGVTVAGLALAGGLPAVAAIAGAPASSRAAGVSDAVGSPPALPLPGSPDDGGPSSPDVDVAASAQFVFADAGNYILYDAEPAIRAAFGDSALFSSHTIGGFGLSSDWNLWNGVLGTDVPSNDPAVVVMMMGNADFDLARRDPDWYRYLLQESVRMMTLNGAKVLWLGLPPLPANVRDEFDRQNVNAMYRELEEQFPGVVKYVSTDDVLGFHGVWVRSMPDDPDHRPIRKVQPDGSPDMHVCQEGAMRLAHVIHDEMAAMVTGVPVEPWDWENGAWRWDIRYDDPMGACLSGRSVAGGPVPLS